MPRIELKIRRGCHDLFYGVELKKNGSLQTENRTNEPSDLFTTKTNKKPLKRG